MLNPEPSGTAGLPMRAEQGRSILPATPDESYGYPAKAGDRELSLMLLWRVALEWRWLILAAFGLGLVGAVTWARLAPTAISPARVASREPAPVASGVLLAATASVSAGSGPPVSPTP